jgi:hypothetical protein
MRLQNSAVRKDVVFFDVYLDPLLCEAVLSEGLLTFGSIFGVRCFCLSVLEQGLKKFLNPGV